MSMPVSSISTEIAIVSSEFAPSPLEIVDKLLCAWVVIVDDLTEMPTILRIHLIEHLPQELQHVGGFERR